MRIEPHEEEGILVEPTPEGTKGHMRADQTKGDAPKETKGGGRIRSRRSGQENVQG